MDKKEFERQVIEFAEMYCQDYAYVDKVEIEYEFDDCDKYHEAMIYLTSRYDDYRWEIPICIDDNDDSNIAINRGDNGSAEANGANLYAFLWFQAIDQLGLRGQSTGKEGK